MAVYIDRPKPIFFKGKDRRFVHLAADSLAELHAFAQRLGLPLQAFQDKPHRPHYDIFDAYIDKAKTLGAQSIGNKDMVHLLRARYGG